MSFDTAYNELERYRARMQNRKPDIEADLIELWRIMRNLKGQAIEAHNRDLLQEVFETMKGILNVSN